MRRNVKKYHRRRVFTPLPLLRVPAGYPEPAFSLDDPPRTLDDVLTERATLLSLQLEAESASFLRPDADDPDSLNESDFVGYPTAEDRGEPTAEDWGLEEDDAGADGDDFE